MYSYKNKVEYKGKGKHYEPIGEYVAPKPPAGKNNSYEQVYEKLCSMDVSAKERKHYSRAKMNNR